MLAVYLFLLVTGGGLALVSLVGGFLEGGGLDLELDGGADFGTETDFSGLKGGWWDAFSLLTLIYGAFGAGGVGTALHLLWGGEQTLVTLAFSIGSGAVCGIGAGLLLSWLRRSGSGELRGEASFEGRVARVILPLRPEVPGRIRVRRGEREHVLRALPHATAEDPGAAGRWERVVVIEVRGGVAYVAPASPELGGAEL